MTSFYRLPAIGACALAVLSTLSGTARAGDLAPGRYTLQASQSGKCVNVAGGGVADGTNIEQATCNGTSAQRFDVLETSTGIYKLLAVVSGKAMDVSGSSPNDGANVQAWSDNGTNAQRFGIHAVSGSSTLFTLTNVASGKCVDVVGGFTTDGANVQQWACNGNAQQHFQFDATYIGATAPAGRFAVINKASGECLDVAGGNTADGAAADQQICDGSSRQKFALTRDADGYFQLSSELDGKVVDVYGSSKVNGGKVDLWTNFDADNQRFVAVDLGNGLYGLKSKASGKCVEVVGASKAAGALIDQTTCSANAAAQQWTFATSVSRTAQLRQNMLAYFYSISGNHTLVGIENKDAANPTSDTAKVNALAGRESSFWGGDFGFGSSAVSNRSKTVAEARNQFAKGALPTLMYHACAPTRDEYCSWDDIGGANPAKLSAAQFQQLLTPGTTLYNNWIGRLNLLAGYFQALKDAGVVVLFRPLHEMNQCVFWWSCHTGTYSSAALYRLTHDYLVNTKGLDNIIWVWNVQDFTTLNTDVDAYTPGAAYFDIASLDVYNTGYTAGNYSAMLRVASGKLIAIGENQFVPTASLLAAQPKWLYEMLWPDFTYDARNVAALPGLYGAGNVLSLDEMPGWK